MGLALVHVSHAQNSQQDYLNAHNAARAEVGVSSMTWDDTVAGYAQNYANQRSTDCKMEHSEGSYGENLASGTVISGADAVNMWVSVKQFYDHNSNTCNGGECRRYSQVVWGSSVRLGCARVQCNSGDFFVTCNYDPPGNYEGQSPY